MRFPGPAVIPPQINAWARPGAAARAYLGSALSFGRGVCRYEPVLMPKLGIAARYEFLNAFLCFFVIGAFHIDGVRNMPVLIKELGSIMRHCANPTPEATAISLVARGESICNANERPPESGVSMRSSRSAVRTAANRGRRGSQAISRAEVRSPPARIRAPHPKPNQREKTGPRSDNEVALCHVHGCPLTW